MDTADSPPRSRASGRSGPRTKLGCLTCRRRKVRCDQPSPTAQGPVRTPCSNCNRLKLDCSYTPPGTQQRRSRKLAGKSTGNAKNPPAIRQAESPDSSLRGGKDSNDVGIEEDGPGSIPGCNSQCAPSWQQAMFMAPSWLPPSGSDSQHPLDPLSGPDYLIQQPPPGESQIDKTYEGVDDFSGFSIGSESQWQTAFTPGLLSPTGGLLLSSLLPWKDLPPSLDSPAGDKVNQPGSQVHQRSRSSTANQSRRQPTSPSTSSTPKPVGSGSSCTPRRHRPVGIDLAQFDVTERQRSLLHHFNPVSNPIPLIAPIDSQWQSVYSSLLHMACNCPHLINAICSVSELHLSDSGRGTVEQAFAYYQSASNAAEAILGMASTRVEDRMLKQAFATLFLLMRAEASHRVTYSSHLLRFPY